MKILKAIADVDVITNVFYGFLAIASAVAGLPFLVILAPTLLMIGSGIHHHYATRTTAYLDWIPIYMVFSAAFAHIVLPPDTAPALWFIMAMGAALFDITSQGNLRNPIMGVIAVMLLTAITAHFGFSALMETSFNFALAFVPWKLGEEIKKVNYRESNKYKMFHGMWHILTTHAIWQLYKLIFSVDMNAINTYILA